MVMVIPAKKFFSFIFIALFTVIILALTGCQHFHHKSPAHLKLLPLDSQEFIKMQKEHRLQDPRNQVKEEHKADIKAVED